MHSASYCNVYISRPTRCTNSYNESLLIIKRPTCFGLFSPSSGAPDDGHKSPKHVERLMINKDSLLEFVNLVGLLIYTFLRLIDED